MHQEQVQFFLQVRNQMPWYFERVKVYDFGSRNVNGDNTALFKDSDYTGIDIGPGRNVDLVGKAHEVWLPGLADVVISGEMLEHDKHWHDSLRAFVRWCRPGGLVLVTCATEGRPEHGTSRSDPESSQYTLDYYRNLTRQDFELAWPDGQYFYQWVYTGNSSTCDLYFWGIRNAVDLSNISEAA